MFEELLSVYEEENQRLNELRQKYDALKHHLTFTKLEKKYSIEFDKYKTIKEKEERASLETQDLTFGLLNLQKKIQDQQITCDLIRFEIEYKLRASEN